MLSAWELPEVYTVDATKLGNLTDSIKAIINERGFSILLQCPWIAHQQTAELVQQYMASAVTIQPVGSFVFIGIANCYP